MKNANSFYQKPKDAVLVFADGSKFYGYGIGNYGSTIGEICFNTSITGYQEILTDPSYSGQIINFTFPHIGNVGVNSDDIEAKKVRANGLIIRETITNSANYRANNNFNEWLKKHELTGISVKKFVIIMSCENGEVEVYEEREDYERCQKLKEMKDKSIKINKNKTL